ncbi:hypothetical protein COOONC_26417 [Cooperia oncophora]
MKYLRLAVSPYSSRKSRNSKLGEELSTKVQRISELEEAVRDAENGLMETRAESAEEIAKVKEELAETNALVGKLTTQLEVNSRAIPVEEVEKQLSAVQSSIEQSEGKLKSVTEERDRVLG